MQTPFPDIVATATAYLSEVDPVMRATIERVGPCTLEPDPDIFNALVDAIISQSIENARVCQSSRRNYGACTSRLAGRKSNARSPCPF